MLIEGIHCKEIKLPCRDWGEGEQKLIISCNQPAMELESDTKLSMISTCLHTLSHALTLSHSVPLPLCPSLTPSLLFAFWSPLLQQREFSRESTWDGTWKPWTPISTVFWPRKEKNLSSWNTEKSGEERRPSWGPSPTLQILPVYKGKEGLWLVSSSRNTQMKWGRKSSLKKIIVLVQ